MNHSLYQARILDHAAHPRNKRVMENADIVEKGSNPSCGDSLTMYIVLDGDMVRDASFDGTGCAISQAAASLLTEKLRGLTKSAALALSEADVYALLGVPISAGREKCALLAWRTLISSLRGVSRASDEAIQDTGTK